jgi:LytTr DNA-binding domain
VWCDCAGSDLAQGEWTTAERFRAAFLSPAPYVAWVALSLSLAISGPFGTYVTCSFAERLWCFSVLVGLCLIYGIGARACLQSIFRRMGFWQASSIVIGASVFLLPAPLAFMATRLTGIGLEAVPNYFEMALIVLVFGLTTAAIRWTMARETVGQESGRRATRPTGLSTAPGAAALPDNPKKLPRLVARLPKEASGRLIRLSARNHYVDVVTDRGTASLLIRLSDAIAELEGVDGLRVHRSHWVAADAVCGHERRGDKRLLVLADGARVPVSRNLQRDVSARGFF